MSNFVPDGWSIQELGDVTEKIEGGGTPSRTEPAYWSGDIPWVTVKDLKKVRLSFAEESISALGLKESASRLIPRNTLIIATRMALGKAVMFDRAVTINQDLKAVFPKRELDSEYLLHWYLSKAESIQSMGTGSTVKGIRLDDLRLIPIALPPLKEQQKIAAILTTVDEVIASTTAQINKLKDLKTGMMQELLTKGIGHTEFKDSPVGRIPKSWEVLRCNEVAEKITDGEHLSPKYVEIGQPILSAKDVLAYGVDFSNAKQVSDNDFKKMLARCNPEYGDVLIVSRGATIGKTTLNVSEKSFALMGSVILLKPNKKKTVGSYLSLLIAQTEIQNEMLSLSGSSAQQAIYLKDIKDMRLRIPPILEQEAISKAIDSLDQRIITVSTKFSAFEKLKKSLMQDLLTGKVRVRAM